MPAEENTATVGDRLADGLRSGFDFDFVGVSLAPRERGALYNWSCLAGSLTPRTRRIWLPEGVGALGTVAATKRGLVVGNTRTDIVPDVWYQFPIVASEGLTSLLAFPLLSGDDLAFVVLCAYRDDRRVTPGAYAAAQERAARISGLATSDMEPSILRAESMTPVYAETTHKIIQAQEDERKRIARELHDGLAQELLLVQIELRKAKYLPEDEVPEAIKRASEELREVLTHVSRIASNLRPASLDELGLAPAIEAECRQIERSFGVQVTDRIERLRNVNPDAEVALYRIFQEASSNACKYSRSDTLDVALASDDAGVCLTVRDFGVGFNVDHPEIHGGGLGLAGMRERAGAFGGEVSVESAPGEGCSVRVRIPFGGQGRKGTA